MYNPGNVLECEKGAQKKALRQSQDNESPHRQWDDRVMLFVGAAASLSSAPQIFKIFQTKAVADISLSAYLISLASVIAWFIYGVHIKNKPLAMTTFISIVILSTVVIQIFVYG